MAEEESQVARPPRAGVLGAAKAVCWAFFGVRGRSEHAQDLMTLSPWQVIVTGVIAGVLFVLTLVLLVKWATA
jgi:hypothetical protein